MPALDDQPHLPDFEGRFLELEETVKAARSGHDAAAFLAAIVESSEDAIISKSLTGTITTWNKAAERLFGYNVGEAVGQPVTMLIPEDRLDEEPGILARIRAGERIQHFETIRRRKDGTLIDVSLTVSPIRDRKGRIIGASKIARDISERRRAAEHQDLLLREMHHRVKNLFAITSSIITLAARNASSAAALAADMKDRLVALSRAHEMTLPSFTGDDAFRERPATLFQLLSSILKPFAEEDGSRWTLSGEDIEVPKEHVTNLALLFHELATNAAKYGALSVPGGRLEIQAVSEAETFHLLWKEINGPDQPAAPGHQTGFGTRLEAMVTRTLQGEIIRELRPEGLRLSLKAPAGFLTNPQ
ncbi:PAS domain S-box protein [Rhizobium sp. P32RR-XVIII]|uniref:PAS domain S-box protein n=1 Tax=Rhizobium sp. P32RR-XVIII TaxID=2726738 RepID=UPI0014571076|nr:PAS domain S-box protein [Rhizobium sp. P32RR-XVIII]NLS07182.1 PAS domain S-box protein [Rhizobium sp. P32RR-XVIII]